MIAIVYEPSTKEYFEKILQVVKIIKRVKLIDDFCVINVEHEDLPIFNKNDIIMPIISPTLLATENADFATQCMFGESLENKMPIIYIPILAIKTNLEGFKIGFKKSANCEWLSETDKIDSVIASISKYLRKRLKDAN